MQFPDWEAAPVYSSSRNTRDFNRGIRAQDPRARLEYDTARAMYFPQCISRLAGLVHKQQDPQTGGRDIVEAAAIHIHRLYSLLCLCLFKEGQQVLLIRSGLADSSVSSLLP